MQYGYSSNFFTMYLISFLYLYVPLFMQLYLFFLKWANLQSKQAKKKENKLAEESLQGFETD